MYLKRKFIIILQPVQYFISTLDKLQNSPLSVASKFIMFSSLVIKICLCTEERLTKFKFSNPVFDFLWYFFTYMYDFPSTLMHLIYYTVDTVVALGLQLVVELVNRLFQGAEPGLWLGWLQTYQHLKGTSVWYSFHAVFYSHCSLRWRAL